MKAPDKIFLQVCGSCTEEGCEDCKFEDLEDNVTWCKDRIYKKDIAYIRKDALLEWAKIVKQQSEELKEAGQGDVFYGAQIALIDEVIAKIKSL